LNDYRLHRRGQPAHNAYLSSLAELGVVGLLLFVWVLAATYSTLRRLTRQAEEDDDAFIATLSRALIVSLAGYALCAMFLSIETYRVLWILLGLTLALPRLTRDHQREIA
jgi:Kef-type K+ transport system membrane component KefB